jgi:hypothetical protein
MATHVPKPRRVAGFVETAEKKTEPTGHAA